MKKLSLIIFFFVHLSAFAGDSVNIGRIKMFLSNTDDDSSRCELLIDLVQEYTDLSSDSAIYYLEKASAVAEQLQNKTLLGKCYHSYGNIHYYKSNYADALHYYLLALKLNEESGDKKAVAGSLNNIGNVYWLQGKYDEALEFYFRDLEIAEEFGDYISEAKTLGNIGLIYDSKKEYDKALEYYFESAEKSEKIQDLESAANAYINIGLLMQTKKQFSQSLDYYKKAQSIAEATGNKDALALVSINTGSCYNDLEQLDLAISFLKKGLELSKESGTKYYMKFIYSLLSDIYKKKNDFKSSLDYHELLTAVKDSLYNEESSRQLNELQTKYDTEKKQKKIEIQNLELKEKQLVIYAVSVGMILMVLLAFAIYRGYKQKKKINRELELKNETITLQKNEIELKNTEIGEKNKNITDSIEYAKTLQDAILPDAEKVMRSLPGSFIFFKPRDIVSGDFYWYNKKDEIHYIIAADCTGHGVPGAFVSMLCNNLLNETIIHQKIDEPGRILTEVNKKLFSVFQKEGSKTNASDGMDIAICKYNSMNKLLEFSGAMNSAVLIRGKNIIELPADKTSIGGNIRQAYQFSNLSISLEKEDCIYIFSDGFQDQFGGKKGKKYMLKNFKNLLSEISSLTPSQQTKELDRALKEWQGNFDQVDDILVVGFKQPD